VFRDLRRFAGSFDASAGGAMQRRAFLKAVAVAAPAAGLQTFLVAQARVQSPAAPLVGSLYVVGAKEDRFGHPHTLGYSSILFKVPTSETAGGLFVMEHTHLLPVGPRCTCTFLRRSGST
jgi:hypothetical protein